MHTIAVHDGIMHADEVFAVAVLKFLHPKVTVIRTRNKDALLAAECRIDVGGKYDKATLDFDHHQPDFTLRHAAPSNKKFTTGPKYASFGLVWLHYGKVVIEEFMNHRYNITVKPKDIDIIHTTIDNSIVSAIDAIDNGEGRDYFLDGGVYKIPSAIGFISSLNPIESIESVSIFGMTDNFIDAVAFAKTYLTRAILREYNNLAVEETILTQVRAANEEHSAYLILPTYIPWYYTFRKNHNLCKNIDMIIYNGGDGQWKVQSVYYNYKHDQDRFSDFMPDGTKRKLRFPAPKHICGKVIAELQELTDIPDAVFCHSGGFISSAMTKDGAIKLANYIVANQD